MVIDHAASHVGCKTITMMPEEIPPEENNQVISLPTGPRPIIAYEVGNPGIALGWISFTNHSVRGCS